jgi:hypothetical protein
MDTNLCYTRGAHQQCIAWSLLAAGTLLQPHSHYTLHASTAAGAQQMPLAACGKHGLLSSADVRLRDTSCDLAGAGGTQAGIGHQHQAAAAAAPLLCGGTIAIVMHLGPALVVPAASHEHIRQWPRTVLQPGADAAPGDCLLRQCSLAAEGLAMPKACRQHGRVLASWHHHHCWIALVAGLALQPWWQD